MDELHNLALELELMDPQGPSLKAERVKALHQYLQQLNGGQGPGFSVFGFVIRSLLKLGCGRKERLSSLRPWRPITTFGVSNDASVSRVNM